MRHLTIVSASAVLLAAVSLQAQDLVTSAGTWLFGATLFQTNAASTQEELPGMGHKYELLGGMRDDQDLENPTNDTISIDTTGGVIGLAFRNLPPGIHITALDSQLGLKYYFVAPRTCGGGSPRVTLLIDSDGNGSFNFAAHGHVNPPTFTGCPPNTWVYENLTDDLKRWETTRYRRFPTLRTGGWALDVHVGRARSASSGVPESPGPIGLPTGRRVVRLPVPAGVRPGALRPADDRKSYARNNQDTVKNN